MINKCPGQDKKNIVAQSLECSKCGYEIEIFSDEIKIICPKCHSTVYREVLPTCIDWCKHAKECVGEETFGRHIKAKSLILKNRLINELEAYFAKDARRINHAKEVLDYAEELLRKEGGDWQIVVPAAILHDIGIKAAERKYGSSAGHLQEREGPNIARKVLLKTGFKNNDIEEICQIIAHHHSPDKVKTHNFKLLLDADWLANLKDEVDLNNKGKLARIIEKIFFTKSAKEIAKNQYLSKGG